MKYLILLLTLCTSTIAWGQYDEYQYPRNNKKDPQLEYKIQPEEVNRTTPETSLLYLKSGFSVGSVNGENSQFTPAALGNRQYADEFYYGAELSTHTGNDSLKTTMMMVQFGHHFLTWRHRVKPYIGGMFGYATLKDGSDKNRPEGSGVALGLDIGFQIYKVGPFVVNTGLNMYSMNYNKPETKNSNFQDIYLLFGVNF